MAAKKRSSVFRKLKLIPAAAVSLLVLLVLALLNMFNISLPSLSSEQASESSQEETESEGEQQMLAVEIGEEMTRVPEVTSDQPAASSGPPAVVDVLIDGDRYFVARSNAAGDNETVRQPMPLDQIVSLAEAAVGDAAGVRVRIQRTFAATAQADQQLLDALVVAGLVDDEIDHRRTLVAPPSDP